MRALTAVLDSCVLYPAPLRDLLMRVAVTGIFRARWSDEIHEEWVRSVLKRRPDLTREQLARTRELMNRHAPECLVTGYEALAQSLSLPDPDDRHVLAAAIKCRAHLIVTINVKDFPEESLAHYGIEAEHPDLFLSDLIDRHPVEVMEAALGQWRSLKNPPKTRQEFLESLERQGLVRTVAALSILLPQEKD